MPTLSITAAQLQAAFIAWEQDNRAGQHRAEQNSREQNRNRQYYEGGHHG